MDKSIWTIIVTFNNERYIRECLGSLAISNISTTVVVIDNASSDDTVSIIKNEFPQVKLIESEQNLGFGRANNIGIEMAYNNGADYVFLLNQDAWVEESSLNSLIDVLESNSNYGIVAPVQFNENWTEVEYQFARYLKADYTQNYQDDLETGELKNVYEARFLNAAAWMISRKAISIIGGFDPLFFMYGEDDNYIDRLHYHSFKLGLVPSSRVAHARHNASEISRPTQSMSEEAMKRIKKFEVQIKVKLLNPNLGYEDIKNSVLTDLNRKVVSTCVKLNWKHCYQYNRIRKSIKSLQSVIVNHRNQAIESGAAFLNLDKNG